MNNQKIKEVVTVKMGKTSDTSGLTYVESLSDELLPVFEQAEMKYPECAIELFFVFRCLPEESEQKSSVRYAEKEQVIYFDMTVSEDRYKEFSKRRQRVELSHSFYAFLSEKIKKYKIANLDHEAFLKDMEVWLKEIGWLEPEADVEVVRAVIPY
ncbi:hypothetical protein N6H13_05095 [Paenibacillus sp. CC-CFT742]|nr:hypothetical protein [Paenibacillus sp. CC-CFT742]WJH30091.1 hypothetical protein N6H13_05095 [Paenibacillus sp. CC-CFT742]